MSYFSTKARERRDRLRADGRCIWCGELLVYAEQAERAHEYGLAVNHTLAPRIINGQPKKSERCDLCRSKEKKRRANRNSGGAIDVQDDPVTSDRGSDLRVEPGSLLLANPDATPGDQE